MSESGDCRYEREGYCGYSQETVNALCKSRDDRIRELEAENKKLKERIAELEKPNAIDNDGNPIKTYYE